MHLFNWRNLPCLYDPSAKWLLHDIRRRTRDTQQTKVRDRENEVNNGDTLRR